MSTSGSPFTPDRAEDGEPDRQSRVGMPAPPVHGQAYVAGEIRDFSLEELRGRWVVLLFYPLDFTFICPTELRAFGEDLEAFRTLGAEVVAASVDSVYAHKAWLERDLPQVRYPVLSDITKQVARTYGVLDEDQGVALRGTFIVDPNGVIQYQVVSALSVGRSTDETLRVLQGLQTGELCPVNWRPGQQTLGEAA